MDSNLSVAISTGLAVVFLSRPAWTALKQALTNYHAQIKATFDRANDKHADARKQLVAIKKTQRSLEQQAKNIQDNAQKLTHKMTQDHKNRLDILQRSMIRRQREQLTLAQDNLNNQLYDLIGTQLRERLTKRFEDDPQLCQSVTKRFIQQATYDLDQTPPKHPFHP
jgi:F0F1-type ATP synthase membrane subunit b/b'